MNHIRDTITNYYKIMINEHCKHANDAWVVNFGEEHGGDCLLKDCQQRIAVMRYNKKIRYLGGQICSKLHTVSRSDVVQIYLAFDALVLRGEIRIKARELYLPTKESADMTTYTDIDVNECIPYSKKISRMSNIIDGILSKYDYDLV